MDLATLWFFIVGVLFVGYFVLDGFDFGVGMALPFLGKDEVSRRQVINTIGPVWDLNETWVIVAGACLFAAFPEWYATLFSGFYLPLLLILLALIARGVSFEYRHQRDDIRWKRRFDWMITIGSAVPALLWGVAVGNIVQGVPIDADKNFTGNLFTLLNPYGLWVGVTTLLLFFLHGVYFVGLKTDGQVHHDAQALAKKLAIPTVIFAAGTVLWTIVAAGREAPLLWAVIACGVIAAVALLASVAFNWADHDGRAFAAVIDGPAADDQVDRLVGGRFRAGQQQRRARSHEQRAGPAGEGQSERHRGDLFRETDQRRVLPNKRPPSSVGCCTPYNPMA